MNYFKPTIMKKLYTLALLALFSLSGQAQRSPEHPMDIQDASFDQIENYLRNWLEGSQQRPNGVSSIDDEFFKSRVKKRARITDGDYKANPLADPKRKMCIWVPMDDPTTKWKSHPRYCFEGDNFSLWSYIDIHGNWTAPWFRCAAGIADVAHKNGVSVGTCYPIGWNANVRTTWTSNRESRILRLLVTKEGTAYKYAPLLVKLMKYYGFEGIGINSEFNSNVATMTALTGFFVACHKEAKKIDWDFQVYWYDGTNDYGTIDFDRGLNDSNKKIFGDSENVSVDMMFANYNWHGGTLSSSVTKAESLNRSSYDYYAGFDIQGRALNNDNWQSLVNNKISVGFWGAHSQSLIHQSATDDGTSDIAIQKAYLKKQELMFSGGNRNPGLLPNVRNRTSLANASLEGSTGFHGLARLLTAKSTIHTVPFVTRFNLGNGLKFRNEGKVAFDHKWYNISTQDYMPTWRWWITDRTDVVTQENLNGFVKAELTFDDAWWGGSCLSLSGATEFSRVKLFKTMLEVQPDYEFSIVYKTVGGTATHAKLFVALKDQVTTYKEIDIPATQTAGEWATFTVTAQTLGLNAGDKVAMMGLVVEGSPANYQMLVGEMALRNPSQSFTTPKPMIKELQVLRGRYNACDFKIRYAQREEAEGEKVYNDDVDTWYFEIWFKQDGQEPQYLTATTSWAAYVIDAPMVPKTSRQCEFGVRAVSPDGKYKSDITWMSQEVPYNQPLSDVVVDRPVIKANEQFTMRYLDTMTPEARRWDIIDPATNQVVQSASNSTSCTLTLPTEGLYDLKVVAQDGTENITRGKIQVTPAATGSVPQIDDITSNKNTAATQEEVTYTYTGRKGEGSVSRALVVKDPEMFMIPGEVQLNRNYSYALWFKADKFTHDKQGTNLINKNTIKDQWPHNNWGDLWVTIRPESSTYKANEVSFNTMGWTAHDVPNENMMTTGYSVTPGIWNHVVVTHDNANNQKIYFNGKLIKTTVFSQSKRREEVTGDPRIKGYETANIFIGGGGVYKAGFVGAIDEVQVWNKPLSDEEVLQAMKGYKESEVPEGLQAYYTFERMENDGTFKNLGKAGGVYPGKIVVMEGSGGETTSSADYVQKDADNKILGFPGIEGTLPVTTEATWTSEGMMISSASDMTAVVTYTTPGTKSTTLTLTNGWGEATKTVDNIVEITGEATGIETLNQDLELTAYPNPFVESVNLRFAQDGRYTINIFDAKGARLQTNSFDAQAAQVVNVTIKGNAGMYVVQVLKDNKPCKSLKLIKK